MANYLTIISLCTRSQTSANSACMTITSCLLEFIFINFLPGQYGVLSKLTSFWGSLPSGLPPLLGSASLLALALVLTLSSSTGVVSSTLVSQLTLRPQSFLSSKALLPKFPDSQYSSLLIAALAWKFSVVPCEASVALLH